MHQKSTFKSFFKKTLDNYLAVVGKTFKIAAERTQKMEKCYCLIKQVEQNEKRRENPEVKRDRPESIMCSVALEEMEFKRSYSEKQQIYAALWNISGYLSHEHHSHFTPLH